MSEAPVFPRLDNTVGAIFVGVILGAALWGISCMQTYEYFSVSKMRPSTRHTKITLVQEYRRDAWFNKIMVGILFILDTVHQIFWTHVLYIYLITEYFNIAYLNQVVWSLVAQIIISALVGLIVQSFFLYRIWILSRHNIYAVAIVGILVVAEFGVSIAYFTEAWKVTTFDLLPNIFRLSQSVNSVAAAGDIAIAVTLIFILYRSKTGFSKSDSIVKQLILYSLNTGFLTSICALMSLITITLYPTNFMFMTFYIVLARLYTNSLLATLNARKKLRVRVGTSHNSLGSSETRDIPRNKTDPSFSIIPKQETSHHLAIRVDTETARGYDATISKNNDYELSVFGGREQAKNQEHAV
ncbi:hypothetical protein D9615_006446 [Tricholomella constricta]|uniref:DUF6534 domain-containing protein n=1 Tax=Tricholomella constricta TaxID=117010 RepID=A0A8H5H5X2_9AGAR|nr:hypothetical protein D9615_006446 [Tricholomella constricta]